jgi:hypothetical protein
MFATLLPPFLHLHFGAVVVVVVVVGSGGVAFGVAANDIDDIDDADVTKVKRCVYE